MKREKIELRTPASKKKVELDESKPKKGKRKVRKKTRQRKRRRVFRTLAILLFLVILLAALLYFVNTQFTLEKVSVSGNTTYSEAEITTAIQKSKYSKNTLFFWLYCRSGEKTFLPFIQKTEINIKDRNTIQVKVTESKRVGKIERDGYYWYYDKKGILLEKKTENYTDVVNVEGLSYREFKLNEEIPIVQTGCFDALMTICQSIEKYGTPIETIQIKNTEDIKLISGELTVNLGDTDYLEQKMEELYPVIQTANQEELKGTIDMQYFSEEEPRIIFY